MGKVINYSDGRSIESHLIVRNVTGISEERGFRLFWTDAEERFMSPDPGYLAAPFRTMREAIAYGERVHGERAKYVRD
jgi:hypothetical protein